MYRIERVYCSRQTNRHLNQWEHFDSVLTFRELERMRFNTDFMYTTLYCNDIWLTEMINWRFGARTNGIKAKKISILAANLCAERQEKQRTKTNISICFVSVSSSMSLTAQSMYKGYERAFCVRMKSTLTKRGCHFKSSGYRVSKTSTQIHSTNS